MNDPVEQPKPPSQKLGWGILLAISALLVLGCVDWFFAGPDSVLSWLERGEGVPMEEFTQAYSVVEQHIFRNEGQKSIWITSFELLALIVALEGFRRSIGWAWNATWVLVAAPIAVGLNYLPGGELSFDNVGLFFIGAVAIVGQMLARPR